jgi:predicted nucleotidyltransferase
MQFGLSKKTLDSLNNIFRRYPQIEKVIIYGSRAKGNFTEGSDIDLTIVGQKADPSILPLINNEIENLLLPYLFDISIYNNIKNKDLIEHIKRVGLTFYKKPTTSTLH